MSRSLSLPPAAVAPVPYTVPRRLAVLGSSLGALLAMGGAAFAQTATGGGVTAQGLLTSSGADLTQSYATVALVAGPIILTALAITVVMILRRGARSAKG